LPGRVDRRKFSYNSALMIRANCLLHEVKGEAKYLDEAQRIARAAEAHWIVPETGAVKDGGKFAHMLLEALLATGRVDRDPHWLRVVQKSAAYVHENVRDPNGRYAHRWDRPQQQALESFMLIDQASAARAFFVVAGAMGGAAN
jgi:mannose/cellobiose epimerase-like protein (N-acyl-D-glucosamine 2-epimerase family)